VFAISSLTATTLIAMPASASQHGPPAILFAAGAPVVAVPNSPVGKQLTWLLGVGPILPLSSKKESAHFDVAFIAAEPIAQLNDAFATLGEIIVHGEDIRRPLGLEHRVPLEARVALADNCKNTNLLIGTKRRNAGLQLRATDALWMHGGRPEVAGPLPSLILAMTGRKGALVDPSGDGASVLAARM